MLVLEAIALESCVWFGKGLVYGMVEMCLLKEERVGWLAIGWSIDTGRSIYLLVTGGGGDDEPSPLVAAVFVW
jgi:hypothetical protein